MAKVLSCVYFAGNGVRVRVFLVDYFLQVLCHSQLVNLVDLAMYARNVSFFILALLYLRRGSVRLDFIEREEKVVKITGPWKAAVLYALGRGGGAPSSYDRIFSAQFFDLEQHAQLPLPDFVDVLCENFARYQRQVDGAYQIIPTP